MRNWLALISCAAFGACAPAAGGPETVVKALYAPYLSHAAEQGGFDWDKAPVYSKAFKTEIERGLEYGRLLNEPVIDFDPIADAQDFSLANLNVKVDRPAQIGKAHVTAQFDNLGKTSAVGFDMAKERGVWKIEAIHDGDEDLRAIIEEALKPAGDPAAMKAPVAAIYQRYEASGAGDAPLESWAPLSSDLKAVLNKPAKGGGLGFDPITDGQGGAPGEVSLEVAGSAVIARFSSGGARRVVVYDVVSESGGWRIDDIRGPDSKPQPWDVSAQLGNPPPN
jgi:hypothetical protein